MHVPSIPHWYDVTSSLPVLLFILDQYWNIVRMCGVQCPVGPSVGPSVGQRFTCTIVLGFPVPFSLWLSRSRSCVSYLHAMVYVWGAVGCTAARPGLACCVSIIIQTHMEGECPTDLHVVIINEFFRGSGLLAC